MKVTIRENSWLARIASFNLRADKLAIVFGSTIHLHNTGREEFLNDRFWVCHELKHVEQYKRYGFAGFIFRYLIESMKNGYYNNKFEVEARDSEKDEGLLGRFEF
jgi:hypothetical protein